MKTETPEAYLCRDNEGSQDAMQYPYLQERLANKKMIVDHLSHTIYLATYKPTLRNKSALQ